MPPPRPPIPPCRFAPWAFPAPPVRPMMASTRQRTVALLALSSVPFSVMTRLISPSSTGNVTCASCPVPPNNRRGLYPAFHDPIASPATSAMPAAIHQGHELGRSSGISRWTVWGGGGGGGGGCRPKAFSDGRDADGVDIARPPRAQPGIERSRAGLLRPTSRFDEVEIQRSSAPPVDWGFYLARADFVLFRPRREG
jgi:hypothetical protein